MTDIHDDRSVPMDLDPISRKDAAWAKLWGWLSRRERNVHDGKVAKAAADNAPIREAEARRTLAQPGASAEAVAKAERVFARIGSGAKK
jgi:hypothetical protein